MCWQMEGVRDRREKGGKKKEEGSEEGEEEGAGKMLGVGRQPFYSMMDSFKETT